MSLELTRYRLETELGRGGMAIVYRGVDEELRRPVAVKILAEHLSGDPNVRRRFLREARLAAGLNHPNVVAVYDLGERDARPFIVMELVEGESLADLLAREGPLVPGRAVALALQACAGLEHAHRAGLVHRDVKPANLLLRRDGVLKVADFGIARAAAAATRLTEIGTVLGTASYLAPEQASGADATPAADVYGLGAVLYEALAGRPPFRARSLQELAARQRTGRPEPIPGVAPALEAAVLRALEADPALRPASAGDLADELRAAAGPDAPTEPLHPAPPSSAATRARARAVPSSPAPSNAPARRRRPSPLTSILAVAAALLIATGVALAVVLRRSGGRSVPPPSPPRLTGAPAADAQALARWLRAQAR